MKIPLSLRVFALLLLFLRPLHAQTALQIPNPLQTSHSWVSDGANVLSPDDERRLNNLLSPLQRKTGAEVAVVTINSLGGQSVQQFAGDLFRSWKVGRKGEDDGVLILAAISDRKYWIEVGYGLEPKLVDAKVGEISNQQLRPAFKRGAYGEGLYNTALALSQVIDPGLTPPTNTGRDLPPASQPNSQPSTGQPIENYNPNTPIRVYPSGGGAIIGLLGLLVFLFPLFLIGGVVWFFTSMMKRPLRCSKCRAPVQQLSDTAELPSLSPVQQFEQQIGARDYRVWRCQNCHNEDITAHDLPGSQFTQCPTCRHQTASALIEPLRAPTPWQGGLERVILSCQWPECKHSNFYQRATPPMPRGGYGYGGGYGRGMGGGDLLTGIVLGSILNGGNRSGGWGGDSGGGWSGGGDSGGGGFDSGGFDAGPSDFGGGDSGGGGAGGDW